MGIFIMKNILWKNLENWKYIQDLSMLIISNYIKLAVKLKFTKKMLLQEFIYKLFSCMQDWINSRLKYQDNIQDLAIYY